MNESEPSPHAGPVGLGRRHRVFGWWSLLFFLSLGLVLEALHGFKIGWYLDVDHETRRLLLTLAHAHGSLLALVHLALAATLAADAAAPGRWRRVASACLLGASVTLPGGFLLGGLFPYGGDPGLGILLVPVGGLALVVAVGLVAWGVASVPARGDG